MDAQRSADTRRNLTETGRRWADEDHKRPGCSLPAARWGNVELDAAYNKRWLELTGETRDNRLDRY
jgi:hypothetical protein